MLETDESGIGNKRPVGGESGVSERAHYETADALDSAAARMRPAVAGLIPTLPAIFRRLRPSSRKANTLARVDGSVGHLPRRFPSRLSLTTAARARSDRRTHSCFAITARIASTASRKRPQESRYSSV